MRIYWTKHAVQNLDHIEKYIAKDNPLAAVDTVFKILNTVEILADHPYAGKRGRVKGTRELIISNSPFIVPYRIHRHQIDILRVFHSAKSWEEELIANN